MKDLGNIPILCLLYCLQGIPLGLSGGTLSFIMKKHMSYTQIGIFSLALYPFSLKFLWSPLVDTYFFKNFDRRKSWIIPLAILSGIIMICLSYVI